MAPADVAADAAQPGVEGIRLVEPVEVAPGLQQGLLYHVLGGIGRETVRARQSHEARPSGCHPALQFHVEPARFHVRERRAYASPRLKMAVSRWRLLRSE